jgi:cytidine deaminase
MIDIDYLLDKALLARFFSYSPYSKYRVGAALLTTDGTVFLGSNIENASYGLTVCGERVAIFVAIANGIRPEDFRAMAVVTEDGGTSCGACRQVMSEFNREMPIWFAAAKEDKIVHLEHYYVSDLLPVPFKL